MRKHSPSDFVVILPSSIITIPQDSYFGYLPLFYALPKELVEKRPVYLNLPRNILTLIADDQSHDMLNDSFLELVLDCYAWSIWQFLQVPKMDGSYQDIPGDWSNYSGDFPLWRMSYDLIRHFRRIFECELEWSFQRLFTMDKDDEVPWFSYQQFSNIVGNLTDKIVAEENLQPVIDEIWRNRQPEDYNRGSNMRKRDFLRSWNHDRNHTHLSIEQIAEAGASIDGDALFELPDPRGEYETKILSEVQIEQFQKTLSATDVKILQMRMDGCTMLEIAEAVGFKTASAVKKHIDRIAGAYEDFVTDQYGAFLDDHSK